MKTKFHAAIHAYVALDNGADKKTAVYANMKKNLPFLLLADAIRGFGVARQLSHCENDVAGGYSWMEFPMPDVLKTLTAENTLAKIRHELSDQIPKKGDGKNCAVGEYTNFHAFNLHNIGHPYYQTLAEHVMQDNVLDEYLREVLVDVSRRCEDVYVIKHSGKVIDGKTLREQIDLFEDAMFMVCAGKIYQATGTVLNRNWFDDVVYQALVKAYPKELADSAYGYMQIPDDVNERIIACNFELTEEEKAAIFICEDVEKACLEVLIGAYWATKEIVK